MNIIYVAKHGSGDNNDEDAITSALRELGHTVECVPQEQKTSPRFKRLVYDTNAFGRLKDFDFVLFNKWDHWQLMKNLNLPKVFWYFDLVQGECQTLKKRNAERIRWMQEAIPICTLGFCTDGDWASRYPTKLIHLPQGTDRRVAQLRKPFPNTEMTPILFAGDSTKSGNMRRTFCEELKEEFGSSFKIMGTKLVPRRHGGDLADVFANTKIVVAPDFPITDRYWSNRVYVTLGLGGFLLHPRCKGLEKQYIDKEDLVFYNSREHLFDLIRYYLVDNVSRERIREAGYNKTINCHTYKHRCEFLIEKVRERINK